MDAVITTPGSGLLVCAVCVWLHCDHGSPLSVTVQEMVQANRDCTPLIAEDMTFASFVVFVSNLKR